MGDFGVRKYDEETGRFLSTDAKWEEQRFWNAYHYSANNPILLKDPTGLLPGDKFNTPTQAAHDFGKNYNPYSIKLNVEFGTTIIQAEEKGQVFYTYAIPQIGDEGTVDIKDPPEGTKTAGRAHTHGAYDSRYDNNNFSDADKGTAERRQENSYLVTPNGTLQVYDGKTGTTTVKTTDMPSDPKDPDRKNDKKPENKEERPVTWDYKGTTVERTNE